MNPPIRPREDVEFLWQALLERKLDWVVSDHACRAREMKVTGRVTATFMRGTLVYDGRRALGPARGRYLACRETVQAGRLGDRRSVIHSYSQDFPYPQATHILGISVRRTPSDGG